MRARALLVALAGAVGLLLSACGGQLAPDTSKGMRIGFVPKALNQEYWVNTRHGAEAGGRSAHAKVVTLAAQSDAHRRADRHRREPARAEGRRARHRAERLGPAAAGPGEGGEADPGRAVRLADPGLEAPDGVRRDREQGGRRRDGRYLKKVVGKGTLAIIRGIPGSQVDSDRVDGVKQGVRGSGIRVVKEVAANFDRQQAVGAMEDILQTNPKVSAVFCANDQMALGALQTLAARHLTGKIKLVGFDGALEATEAIVGKQMYATVAQDPYGMAQIGVEEAVRAVKHERVRRNVNTGNPLVTQQNAKAYLKKVEKKLGG